MLDVANVLRTSLDTVLYESFEQAMQPDELDVTNSVFFKRMDVDSDAFIYEEFMPAGMYDQHAVGQTRTIDTIATGNKVTREVINYKNTLAIEKEKWDDAKHNLINESVASLGRKGRLSRISEAVANTYADGFDGNTFNTPDGVSLYNNSHTNLNGDTIDNLETGTLTPDNLDTLVQVLRKQKDQRGDLGSHGFAGLLVPTALYGTALEIMDSSLKANTAENNINYFQTKYGTTAIATTPYLDSDYNSATNAATSYYAVGANHFIHRAVRAELDTTLVPWEVDGDDQDRYKYKAGFREVSFPGSWPGSAASNGTV